MEMERERRGKGTGGVGKRRRGKRLGQGRRKWGKRVGEWKKKGEGRVRGASLFPKYARAQAGVEGSANAREVAGSCPNRVRRAQATGHPWMAHRPSSVRWLAFG